MSAKGSTVHFIAVRAESQGSLYGGPYALVLLQRDLSEGVSALKAFEAAALAGGPVVLSVELRCASMLFVRHAAAVASLGDATVERIRDGESELCALPVDSFASLIAECDTGNYLRANAAHVWGETVEDASVHSSDSVPWRKFTDCVNCHRTSAAHVEGKCFFGPTMYDAFSADIAAWINASDSTEAT